MFNNPGDERQRALQGMRIKLYFKRTFLKLCDDYWDCEAAARRDFFERNQTPWQSIGMPPEYILVCEKQL